MKHLLLAILSFIIALSPFIAHSQQPACPSDYWREKHLQSTDFQNINTIFEQQVLDIFQDKKGHQGIPEQIRTVPVVVHIIHDNGPENLSDAQVQQAIQWLNQTLANQGPFDQGSGANTEIQLCLAQRTPEGQSTNGITRDQNALTEMQMETQDQALKNLNRWKPKDYLNIWLVRSICSVTYGCNVYGYSNYPFAHGSNIDGIVIEAAYVSNLNKISGLAHETGHYFGLYHTFEGGCSNNNCLVDGDRICDTPPDQSIVGIPCGDQVNTCNSDIQSGPFATDQPDMTWNYLDYGHLECFHDYTPDQATRMNAALDGIRHSLLESKGCLPPCPAGPVAAFTTSATTIDIGTTIDFQNISQNAASYQWFVNGVNFSNQADAAYLFNTVGSYTVSLSVEAAAADLCEPDTTTLEITVVCPTHASFSLSNLSPEQNDTVQISNQTQNATETFWYLNGNPVGNSLTSVVFNAAGPNQLQLVAGNGVCADTAALTVFVYGFCAQKSFEIALKSDYDPANKDTRLIQTADGNLLAQYFSTQPSGDVPLFCKITPYGKVLWVKRLSGPDSTLAGNALVKADENGGFFLYRQISNWSNVPQQFQFEQFSTDGDYLWGKSIQINQPINLSITDVSITPGGYFLLHNEGLFKLDATGALQWSKRGLLAQKVQPFPDGSCLVLEEMALSRLDVSGNLVWRRNFSPPTLNVRLRDLKLNPQGEIYLAGSAVVGPPNKYRSLLIKLDENGESIWAKYYRDLPISTYETTQLALAADGNPVMAGECQADAPGPGLAFYSFLIKTDQNGDLLWSRHYPPYPIIAFISMNGGGFGLSYPASSITPGVGALHVIKTDAEGLLKSCFEEPHTLNGFSYPLNNAIATAVLANDTVAVQPIDFQTAIVHWQVDTICAPACQTSYEICDNGLDDDGDGLFDCLDPECTCQVDQCTPKYGEKWYFGDKAGIDFSVNPPQPLPGGQTELYEAYSSICDPSGKLLCYTDGAHVYDRFHSIMPNGVFPSENSQAIIIPYPEHPTLYYLFTINPIGQLSYSLIDLSLHDSRGDIVPGIKNVLMAENCAGLAAVVSCGFQGFWLLTLKDNHQFLAFRIDAGGVAAASPVASATTQEITFLRQLKLSQQGDYIACTGNLSNGKSILMLYLFDPIFGNVSNTQEIDAFQTPYSTSGVEFSPNGQLLYLSGNFPGDYKLKQYDLRAVNIGNSVVNLSQLPGQTTGLLQMGPDAKIYAPTNTNNGPLGFKLDVIRDPDKRGLACKFQHEGFDLSSLFPPGGTVLNALPNTIAGLKPKPRIQFADNAADTICALNVIYQYKVESSTCIIDSIVWKNKSLPALVFSNGSSALVDFLSIGEGYLIVTAYTPCGTASDTLRIVINAQGPQKIDLGPDITVCQNGVFTLHAGSGFKQYYWSNNTQDSTMTALQPGTYWVDAWDFCGNHYSDTIVINLAPNSVLNLGPDLPPQCPGFSQTFQRPPGFISWQWSPTTFLNCADCPAVTISPDQNASWIVLGATADGCISVDTLRVFIQDTLPVTLDTFVCANLNLNLFGTTLPPDTTAQFFFPGAGATCDTLWTVGVMPLENPEAQVEESICPGTYFNFHGLQVPPDTSLLILLSHPGECDSLVTLATHSFPALALQLPQDTTIKIGASVLLETSVQGSKPFNLEWSPQDFLSCNDCLSPLAGPLDTQTYTLNVTDANGCSSSGSVTLRVQEVCEVNVPNAFTPNGDGANDLFRPICDPCVKSVLQWRIFNRWGQNVFSQFNYAASDPMLGWDGRDAEGKAQASDVYIWTLELEYFDGRRETKQKEVTLIR